MEKEVTKTAAAKKETKRALGLYLHIPFCIQKCNYCDFLSFGGTDKAQQTAYIKSLIHEINYYGQIYRNDYYVDTLFIGGGTPSLLEGRLISQLMAAVKECFDIDKNPEISIESNPKTLTEIKLNTYLDAGINRISIGAQSFDDKRLMDMGRAHSAKDFFDNYKLARNCGFQNINVDLMFSIPGQTKGIWQETLEKAIELAPEHISFYSLQIEEGTPFFKQYQEGSLKETEDELDREMYHYALELLKGSGYQHYEISNASKEGYQCRHNLKYWSMKDYLGLGLGSHSFIDGIRFSNVTDLNQYLQMDEEYNGIGKNNNGRMENQERYNNPFVEWHHKNSKEENISEYLFTGLRKIDGIDLKDFEKSFDRPIEDVFSKNWHILQTYIDEGYLTKSDENMRFTIKGIDISNTILTEFV